MEGMEKMYKRSQSGNKSNPRDLISLVSGCLVDAYVATDQINATTDTIVGAIKKVLSSFMEKK